MNTTKNDINEIILNVRTVENKLIRRINEHFKINSILSRDEYFRFFYETIDVWIKSEDDKK